MAINCESTRQNKDSRTGLRANVPTTNKKSGDKLK